MTKRNNSWVVDGDIGPISALNDVIKTNNHKPVISMPVDLAKKLKCRHGVLLYGTRCLTCEKENNE